MAALQFLPAQARTLSSANLKHPDRKVHTPPGYTTELVSSRPSISGKRTPCGRRAALCTGLNHASETKCHKSLTPPAKSSVLIAFGKIDLPLRVHCDPTHKYTELNPPPSAKTPRPANPRFQTVRFGDSFRVICDPAYGRCERNACSRIGRRDKPARSEAKPSPKRTVSFLEMAPSANACIFVRNTGQNLYIDQDEPVA